MNVIDYEARGGITARALTEVFYGPSDPGQVYDPRVGDLYGGILKPLVWSGLLSEDMTGGRKIADRVYDHAALGPLPRAGPETTPAPGREIASGPETGRRLRREKFAKNPITPDHRTGHPDS
ncbi:hypothetical protein [Phaeovulum veldkampii]|uniref:hypothetical protein n=1 Tax=Phaeovulum veldkampii TaxID=33049 RepID=UPI00145619B2|nr:hypothetical protein [Phaeovulum veldkampii]